MSLWYGLLFSNLVRHLFQTPACTCCVWCQASSDWACAASRRCCTSCSHAVNTQPTTTLPLGSCLSVPAALVVGLKCGCCCSSRLIRVNGEQGRPASCCCSSLSSVKAAAAAASAAAAPVLCCFCLQDMMVWGVQSPRAAEHGQWSAQLMMQAHDTATWDPGH